MASKKTDVSIVFLSIYSGADKRKHQSSASLAFVTGKPPVTGEFPTQKRPVTRKMLQFDDVMMFTFITGQEQIVLRSCNMDVSFFGCDFFPFVHYTFTLNFDYHFNEIS